MGTLAAACSSSPIDDVAEPAEPVETTTSLATNTTLSEPTTTTTTTTLAPLLEADGIARALVTTTDVVVPVLAITDGGWVVRTPCQELAVVTAGEAVDRVHVVVDPGHGGAETGAVTESGLTESSVNLEVAERVERQLSELGFGVLRTRYADVRVPILTRVEIAESLGADLIVSIHHQGLGDVPTAGIPGTEIYYPRDSSEARRFAGLLHEEAVSALGAFDIEWYSGPDAGATYRLDSGTGEDFYGMVRRPTMPTVLAEMSFMGNPAEEALMTTDEFLDAEAQAITDAVVRWYTTSDPGSGFVEPSFAIDSSGGGGGLGGCEDPDLGPTADLPADVADSVGDEGVSG